MSAMLKQKLIDIANGFTKYGLWKGGGSSALSEMTDVTFTNLQANDVLKYNGSVWVNDDSLQKQIDTLNSNLTNSMNTVTALGNVKANESSSSASLTLSQSLNNFKYLLLILEADGYEDVKMFPVKILSTIENISGRGYYLKVYANDNYFCEVNVGFYNKSQCEVRTLKYSGWTGTVYVYGIN